MNHHRSGGHFVAITLVAAWLVAGAAFGQTLGGPSEMSAIDSWSTVLRPQYFADRIMTEGESIIALHTPYRSEDAAVTPVRVEAMIPQTAERYIETIYLFVDENPEPLVGRFDFSATAGRADLALRVRIDRYTHMRAVAVLNTGEHHLATRFVKAAGGCSAPVAADYASAMENLGEIKLKVLPGGADRGTITQLRVRHPNLTGMQMDYRIFAIRPAHYVKTIKVTLDGEPVMTAEVGISVSADPSFRFFVRPDSRGVLAAEISDSKGRSWTETLELARSAATGPG